ncbi:Coiled-coil domain-containing protein 18, partial [Clarias magur]
MSCGRDRVTLWSCELLIETGQSRTEECNTDHTPRRMDGESPTFSAAPRSHQVLAFSKHQAPWRVSTMTGSGEDYQNKPWVGKGGGLRVGTRGALEHSIPAMSKHRGK